MVGDAVDAHMAVQAKRWKDNIQTPTLQQVRWSIGTSKSRSSPPVTTESARASKPFHRNASPVWLIDGQQLINLLLDHEIGVQESSLDLFELDAKSSGEPSGTEFAKSVQGTD